MKKNIIIIVLFFITFGAVMLMLVKNPSPPSHEVVRDTCLITIRDTIHEIQYQKIKGDRYDSLIHDSIWIVQHCDSVLFDWVAERWYVDTLKNDTDAFISVATIVRMNNLEDLTLNYINRKPTYIYTQSVPKRLELFAGGQIGKYQNNLIFAPVISVRFDKYFVSLAGSIGYINASISYKLNLNQKK